MNAHRHHFCPVLAALMLSAWTAFAGGLPVRPFTAEQIKGDVRVVLLKVECSTVFSKNGFQSQTNQVVHAIPGIGVTCVVEALGDEPKKNWISPNVEVFVAGKRISETPENISAGGNSGLSEFTHFSSEDKPQVANPKRAVVYQTWMRGLRVDSNKIDLHIAAGFNKQTETFVFKDIPVE
jgi:hypothetical protein